MSEILLQTIISACALIGTDSYAHEVERYQQACQKRLIKCVIKEKPILTYNLAKCIEEAKAQ